MWKVIVTLYNAESKEYSSCVLGFRRIEDMQEYVKHMNWEGVVQTSITHIPRF